MKATRFPRLLLIALLVCALAGCAAWRKARTAAARKAEFKLEPAWNTPLEEGGGVRLAAAPGGFLTALPSGRLTFLDAATGKAAWSKDLHGEIAGELVTVAAAGGEGPDPGWAAIALSTGDVAVVPLNPSGRVTRWATGWPEVILTPAGATILALDPRGGAALYRPADAAVLWQVRLPPLAPEPAASCGGIFLFGLADGRLAALAARDGKLVWHKKLGSPIAAEPACAGKSAYAATADNLMYALRLHRKSAGRKWHVRSGADPAAPPLPVGSLVVLVSEDTYIYAFNARNGHLIFRVRLDRRPGPIAILDQVLFVSGSHASQLDAYHLPKGLAAGSFKLPSGAHFITPPVVSGGVIAMGVARYGEEAAALVGLSKAPAANPATPPSP